MKSLFGFLKKLLFTKVIDKSIPFLSTTLVPLLVRCVNVFSLERRRKKIYVSKEVARLIEFSRKYPKSSCYIFYDFSKSPKTYGDFFYSIVLARFLETLDFAVHLCLLGGNESSNSEDDRSMKTNLDFFKELEDIARTLTNITTVEILLGDDVARKLVDVSKMNALIVCEDLVQLNKPIYTHVFDLINSLLERATDSQAMATLLNSADFTRVGISEPATPYIAVPCRFNQIWEKQRNLSAKSFLQNIKIIQNVFPEFSVMIVSDQAGCQFFKNIAESNGLFCYFSQDYSQTFLGNGKLILSSKAWIQVKGGGIGVFAIFSKIAHLTYLVPAHEHSIHEGYFGNNLNFQIFKTVYGEPSRNRLYRDLRRLRQEVDVQT
jgi:hypothetical protein